MRREISASDGRVLHGEADEGSLGTTPSLYETRRHSASTQHIGRTSGFDGMVYLARYPRFDIVAQSTTVSHSILYAMHRCRLLRKLRRPNDQGGNQISPS